MEIKKETKQLRCSCGALVGGLSEKNIKANIILHKRSKKHKEFMEVKASGVHAIT